MNESRTRAGTVVGVGAAACAACCAGPILGLLASIGVATVASVLVFGLAGLLVAVVGVLAVLHHRRRTVPQEERPAVPVALTPGVGRRSSLDDAPGA